MDGDVVFEIRNRRHRRAQNIIFIKCVKANKTGTTGPVQALPTQSWEIWGTNRHLAVSKWIGSPDGFTVTHIPTGLRLAGFFPGQLEAEAFLVELAKSAVLQTIFDMGPVDWAEARAALTPMMRKELLRFQKAAAGQLGMRTVEEMTCDK